MIFFNWIVQNVSWIIWMFPITKRVPCQSHHRPIIRDWERGWVTVGWLVNHVACPLSSIQSTSLSPHHHHHAYTVINPSALFELVKTHKKLKHIKIINLSNFIPFLYIEFIHLYFFLLLQSFWLFLSFVLYGYIYIYIKLT